MRAHRSVVVVAGIPAVLPLLALGAGCATNARKPAAAHASKARPAAVVVFAAPAHAKVLLYEGVDDGVGWTCDGAQTVEVSSEGGFVVAKLPARTGNEKYAIGEIAIADGSERRLRPGANAKVPTFNAVPGKVTLVGGVKVLDVGEGLSLLPDPSVTRARAVRVLARRDRRISSSVAKGKVGKMSWVAMPDSCARH